jgi:squalene synthase HpnC
VTITEPSLDQAYAYCRQLAKSHYENFPVASLLLPKRLRQPISVIYAFARNADDFADEGNAPPAQRLDQLNHYSAALRQVGQHLYTGQNPVFIALADVIDRFNLPIQLFEDLLIAFRQDVLKSRYADFDEVLDYCRFSANPVGRLLLHLDGVPTAQQLVQSDAICSALQLINFYQDIEQDFFEQDRVYIPLDMLADNGLEPASLAKPDSSQLAPVLRRLYQRTAELMSQGHELGTTLHGRLGWEVRAMTLGGVVTLSRLMQQRDDQLLTRPRLTKITLSRIMLASFNKQYYLTSCQRWLTGQ